MNFHISPARTAGLLYLIVVVTGFLSLAYIPSQLFVYADAAKTVETIRASEGLFRIGIAAGLICYTAYLLLAFALYRLLGNANNHAAVLMVALVVAGVPVSFGSIISELNVLRLVSGAAYVQGFTTDQLNASVTLSLVDYRNEILIAKIFWGLWLLPFGYLVFKSGILPRVLGVLLMVGCFGYLIDVFGRTLFTEYSAVVSVVSQQNRQHLERLALAFGSLSWARGTQRGVSPSNRLQRTVRDKVPASITQQRVAQRGR